MILHNIQNLLRQLSDLVDGWDATGVVEPIERDLALDKLKALYEAVRWSQPPSSAVGESSMQPQEEPGEEPLDINLDEVFSFNAEVTASAQESPEADAEPVFVSDEESASVPEEESVPMSEEELASGSSVESEEAPTVEESVAQERSLSGATEPTIEDNDRTEAATTGELVDAPRIAEMAEVSGDQNAPEDADTSEHQGVAEASQGQELAQTASASKDSVVAESQNISEDSVASESQDVAEDSVASESQDIPKDSVSSESQDVSGDSVSSENKDITEVASSSEATSSTASQPLIPTLFGVESTEDMRRHRSKQRVLMSLYDDDPRSSIPPTSIREMSSASGSAKEKTADTVASAAVVAPHSDDTPTSPQEPLPTAEQVPTPSSPSTPLAAVESPQTSSADEEVMEEIMMEEIELSADPQVREAAGEHAVLGDIINHDVHTLADTLSSPRDAVSGLAHSERITDLRKAIGINDRFLLIRDLFGGDTEEYDRAIEQMDRFDDFDDCMIHIAENYVWNANSDGAKFLVELLKRKLL